MVRALHPNPEEKSRKYKNIFGRKAVAQNRSVADFIVERVLAGDDRSLHEDVG